MQKLLGFAPDADPTTPGVLTDCTNLIPYEQGMKGAPTGSTPSGVPALANKCSGAAVVTKLDDIRRIFAGTLTSLYELSGGWTDVSGATYTGGSDARWQFAQFGNSTLATNGADAIQRSASTGAFASIAGAPIAKIMFSVGTQVMALNTNDGTVKTDGWHCCATYDETDWTPSSATLSNKGRIVSSPGAFTAGGRLGEYAIGYKERAIYIGQFVGAPSVWDWTQVAGGEAGCVGVDAWADMGGAHFIVGPDNFWVFDGSRPVPIADNIVREWFYSNSNPRYLYRTQCVADRTNNVVWVFYCSTSSSTPDQALIYHMKTKQWGRATLNVEATLNYVSSGVTIDDLPTYSATIDGLASYSFDSQFWLVGGRSLAAFNTSHQLQSLTGVSSSSSMTTGYAGDDDNVSLLNQLRLRFAPGYKPTTATVQTLTKMELGDSPTVGSSSTMADGKFDVMDDARWHAAVFNFTGPHRVMAVSANLIPGGDR
jgi:hypothetical protein